MGQKLRDESSSIQNVCDILYEIYDLEISTSNFIDYALMSRHLDPAYLDQIQVDPDKILKEEEREIFHSLHRRFASLFSKQPGKYNGKFGYIDNKLQFATPPPPNARTRIPNYSPSTNQLLAEKMDTLEEWGF